MKSKTHHMAEAITAALGPIFRKTPDYKTITEAIALTVARVAQSTPDKGTETLELEVIHQLASKALEAFLNEEEAIQEQRTKVLQQGIEAFAEMVPLNGDDGPAFGLAAINGGVSPEACAEAEEFAGQDHAEVERPACRPYRDEEGDITPEGHIQLKKDILALHTPDKGSWENSPLHEEIARFEQEHPNVGPDGDPGYNPDGPRAYL